MKEGLFEAETTRRLVSFIREKILPDELKDNFDETTSLLELGVLDSLNTAILLNFIQDDIGTRVPVGKIAADNFRDVHTLTAMLCDLRGSQPVLEIA
jgi:acyl carrier protein